MRQADLLVPSAEGRAGGSARFSRRRIRADIAAGVAHTMSPAGGIGASTALQDASELAGGLAEAVSPGGGGDAKAALAGYARRIRNRAYQAIAISERGAARLFAGPAG
ncbi:FAD-dependent monooxygenase [Pseudomonas aeruginosa]